MVGKSEGRYALELRVPSLARTYVIGAPSAAVQVRAATSADPSRGSGLPSPGRRQGRRPKPPVDAPPPQALGPRLSARALR